MSKEKELFDVTVLSRREISVFPSVGTEVKQLLVTYVGQGLPPSTITIDKTKYTEQAEKLMIREDLLRRLKEKPVRLKV